MRRILILLMLSCLSISVLAREDECTPPGQEDFSRFFADFTSDKAFAVRRTIYPLSMVHWHHGMDGTEVAPPERSALEQKQDEARPTLSAFIQENGLASHILDANSKAAIVEVSREGTSWVMTYHFLRKGGCWFLREFQDHSSSNFR